MQYKIINEQPWQILTDAMTISPSETGYELQVAADGKNYTTLFSVGPGITRQITNLSSGSYFRMKGNVGEVTVNWVRSCNSGGSGGGGNAGELEPVSEFPVGVPEGTVVALASGDTVGVYQYDGSEWIPVAGGDMSNYYTKAETNAAITAATEDMATKTWVGQQGYLTQHQDISGKLDVSTFNTYTGATETVLQGKADISDIPDVSNFVTSGEVATQIGTAMSSETARTENTYAKIADIPSLDGYWTSAQTNNAISAATSPIQNQLDDVERVTATALTELHTDILALSAATPDISNYYTSAQTEDVIAEKTAKYFTKSAPTISLSAAGLQMDKGYNAFFGDNSEIWLLDITNGYLSDNNRGFNDEFTIDKENKEFYLENIPAGVYRIGVQAENQDPNDSFTVWTWNPNNPDMEEITSTIGPEFINGYYALLSMMKDWRYANWFFEKDVEKFAIKYNQQDDAFDIEVTYKPTIDEVQAKEEVIAAALVDLNEKKVESQDVKHIVKLTQAEYDLIASPDPETLYIIINNQ